MRNSFTFKIHQRMFIYQTKLNGIRQKNQAKLFETIFKKTFQIIKKALQQLWICFETRF